MDKSLARVVGDRVGAHLPELSFINLHYFYFCATCLVASLIFWGSSTPSRSVSYVDSLFLCVSGLTEAGLNTVNLSELNTFQQVMLFVLIIIGSSIFVSGAILHIRKRAFENKFAELVEQRRRRLQKPRSLRLTWSKRRPSSAGACEVALASGVVCNRPISETQKDDGHWGESRGAAQARRVSSVAAESSKPADAGDPAASGDLNGHIHFQAGLVSPEPLDYRLPTLRRHRTSFFEGRGVGAKGLENHPRNARPIRHGIFPDDSAVADDASLAHRSTSKLDKYLPSVNGLLGRNSQFHHLTAKERRQLGGIEYDAICLLSWLVPLYLALFQLAGAVGVGAWMTVNRPELALDDGLNPFWVGAFFAVSAFNNSGMALLDANATVLQSSYYVLLTLSLLILAGNTCFPPFLRLILWAMKKLIPEHWTSSQWRVRRRTIEFCLDHPRRVYTNLFPSAQTWWLVFSLVMLNGIDWVAFEVLNIGNPTTAAIPAHFRALDGLFQAVAVRSGGFYVVSIAGLRQGLLVLYVLMMFISAFPVAMTIRNTNVYEERSLGIYAEDIPRFPQGEGPDDDEDDEKKDRRRHKFLSNLKRTVSYGQMQPVTSKTWTRQDFVRQQLRGQLGHDLWWVSLAVFIITCVETAQFEADPVVFATFNIIFETMSAYGCVGISTGVPWNSYSFCGAWHATSKLVLCAVMLRGRHRGLPVSIDRAVLLPDESLFWAEEEDAHKRGRSGSFNSGMFVALPPISPARRPRTASWSAPGSGPGPTTDAASSWGEMV